MFREGTSSHCFSQRNTVLSDRDKAGALEAYPHNQDEMATLLKNKGFLKNLIDENKLQPEVQKSYEIR